MRHLRATRQSRRRNTSSRLCDRRAAADLPMDQAVQELRLAWARLRVEVDCGLRRGTWYRVTRFAPVVRRASAARCREAAARARRALCRLPWVPRPRSTPGSPDKVGLPPLPGSLCGGVGYIG